MKRIVAIILRVTTVLSRFISCTNKPYEKETFVYSDMHTAEYYYEGKLHEGDNISKYSEEKPLNVFFEFEAKESGSYYLVTTNIWDFFEENDEDVIKEMEAEIQSNYQYCFFDLP